VNGTAYSTEDSLEIYGTRQLFIAPTAETVTRTFTEQGLFKTKEGEFFLACWNLPTWNKNSVRFDLVDQIQPLNGSQAFTWFHQNAPSEVFAEKLALLDEPVGDVRAALTIRMPARIRDYIESIAAVTGHSVNKVCTGMLETAMGLRVLPVYRPALNELVLADGEPCLDEFGLAKDFTDPRKKNLALIAEGLVELSTSGRSAGLFDYAISALNRLIAIEDDVEGAVMVARWLAKFHRWTHEDSTAYLRKNKGHAS
jgi:hypothetical protein